MIVILRILHSSLISSIVEIINEAKNHFFKPGYSTCITLLSFVKLIFKEELVLDDANINVCGDRLWSQIRKVREYIV